MKTNIERISIITVSYNTQKTIRNTILSVLNQSYHNIEYIVIDGNSTDKTYEIICSYDKEFENKGVRYFHISEDDNGIYDAMNKGISKVEGDWVIFINADDMFADDNVLEEVFDIAINDKAECLYGDTINVRNNIYYRKKGKKIDAITYSVPITHQALFVKADVIRKYLFDTHYKFAADYDQWVRMYVDGVRFLHINRNIAIFNMNGMSQKGEKEYNNEWKSILKKNNFYKNKLKIIYRTEIKPRLKSNNFILGIYLHLNRVNAI